MALIRIDDLKKILDGDDTLDSGLEKIVNAILDIAAEHVGELSPYDYDPAVVEACVFAIRDLKLGNERWV